MPDALEAARAAAAREGVPLERWLERAILARTGEPGDRSQAYPPAADRGLLPPHGAESRREPDRTPRGAEDLSAALGEVSRRLNALLGEVATTPARSSAQLRDTVARVGSRLDALTANARAGQDGPRPDLDRRLAEAAGPAAETSAAPAGFPEPRAGRRPALDAAVAEINARQRMLDEHAAPARPVRQDADAILNLRCDIADLARTVADLAPRRSVEALDASVRSLESRVEANSPPPIDIAQLNELTRMLVEVRESVRDMRTDDSFTTLSEDLRGLHKRFDTLDQMRLEPAVLQHLTGQIAELRATLAQARSTPEADEFAHELNQLVTKIDRIGGVLDDAAAAVDMIGTLERKLDRLAETIATNAASAGGRADDEALHEIRDRLERLHEALETSARDAPAAIERRLDQFAEAFAANAASAGGRADDETLGEIRDRLDRLQTALENTARNAPMAIERSILLLVDKLDRIQALIAGGPDLQSDLGSLGSRLDQIVERLDQSDSRFGQIESIERGLGELFSHLEQTRFTAIDAARAAVRDASVGPVEDLIRDLTDLRAAQRDTELKTHGTLESVHGTLERVIDRLAMLEDDLARRKEPAPSEPAAIQPPPPPAPPAPAAAAPQAALELAPELPPDHPLEPGSRAPILRAGAPLPPTRGQSPAPAAKPAPEPNAKASFIAAARRAAQQASAEGLAQPAAPEGEAAPAGPLAAIARHRTSILAVLVLLAAAAVSAPLVLPKLLPASSDIPAAQPAAPAPAIEPTEPTAAPGPQSRLPSDPGAARAPSPSLLSPESTAGAAAPAFGAAAAPESTADTTNAIRPRGAVPGPAGSKADGELPAAIGPLALRDAALAGDPPAMFEIASRFADGRGTAQSLTEAARWFERAALQGSMPAAYRLGSLYEKGQGVAKDAQMARRYYALAAEAGNVKAMHNLAVLYAEGIDGKPDYRQASQLFRKAADRGLRDSQYNLAILYARGLGVDQNIGESFKWFALAANQGDADAQKKRDDVAARLDAQTLLAARLAVQTWVAQPPDAAANDVRPSADWDRADGGRGRKATGRS